MPDVPEEIKKELRSVLLSKVGGIKLSEFQKDHRRLLGKRVEFCGYRSLRDLLNAIPDVCRVVFDEKSKENKAYGITEASMFLNATARKAQYKSPAGNMSDVERAQLAAQMHPNLLGLYAICMPRTHNMTRDAVNEICCRYGEVEEMSFTERFAFIRYKNKDDALDALMALKEEYRVSVPVERNDPHQVVKERINGDRPSSKPYDPTACEAYIGNIPASISEAELSNLLIDYKVMEIRMCFKDDKKFAFVKLPTKQEVDLVAEAFHNQKLLGHVLIAQAAFKGNPQQPNSESMPLACLTRGNSSRPNQPHASDSQNHHVGPGGDAGGRGRGHGSYRGDQRGGQRGGQHGGQRGGQRGAFQGGRGYQGESVPQEKPKAAPETEGRPQQTIPTAGGRVTPPNLMDVVESALCKSNKPVSKPAYGKHMAEVNSGVKIRPDHLNTNQIQKSPDVAKKPEPTEAVATLDKSPLVNKEKCARKATSPVRCPVELVVPDAKPDRSVEFIPTVSRGHNSKPRQQNYHHSNNLGLYPSNMHHYSEPEYYYSGYIDNGDYYGYSPVTASHRNQGDSRQVDMMRDHGDMRPPRERKDSRETFDLYVGNFPYGTTEDELFEVFAPYGAVRVVLKNSQDRQFRTAGLVLFASFDDSYGAYSNLAHTQFKSRTLYVATAEDQEHHGDSLYEEPRKLHALKCTISSKDDAARTVSVDEEDNTIDLPRVQSYPVGEYDENDPAYYEGCEEEYAYYGLDYGYEGYGDEYGGYEDPAFMDPYGYPMGYADHFHGGPHPAMRGGHQVRHRGGRGGYNPQFNGDNRPHPHGGEFNEDQMRRLSLQDGPSPHSDGPHRDYPPHRGGRGHPNNGPMRGGGSPGMPQHNGPPYNGQVRGGGGSFRGSHRGGPQRFDGPPRGGPPYSGGGGGGGPSMRGPPQHPGPQRGGVATRGSPGGVTRPGVGNLEMARGSRPVSSENGLQPKSGQKDLSGTKSEIGLLGDYPGAALTPSEGSRIKRTQPVPPAARTIPAVPANALGVQKQSSDIRAAPTRNQNGPAAAHPRRKLPVPDCLQPETLNQMMKHTVGKAGYIRKDLSGTVVAVISYISEEDPRFFWAQLHQLMKEELSTLCTNMSNLVPSDEPTTEQRGTALYENEWYRVWVKSVQGNQATVYFIDYGNTSVMPRSDVKVLAADYFDIDPVAIPFRVADGAAVQPQEFVPFELTLTQPQPQLGYVIDVSLTKMAVQE